MTEHGRRRKRGGLSLELVVVVVVMIVFGGGAAIALLFASGGKSPDAPTAVIVDQLGDTIPGAEFIGAATRELEQAGYTVDYIPAEDVTVSLYRDLPTHGYDLVVLRSHAASFSEDGPAGAVSENRGVALFTNEPYSTEKYVEEQRSGLIARASQSETSAPYFALDARFVGALMVGSFEQGSTVILLGCAGMRTPELAQAFLKRGAAEFVSWSEDVTPGHNDLAGALLARNFAVTHGEVNLAVQATMQEVGPDPAFGAQLLAYP